MVRPLSLTLCNELGVDVYVINGSDEGDSLISSEIMRRTSLRPSLLSSMLNTKSSSLTKQITHQTTFNSPYGHLLRSLLSNCRFIFTCNYKTKSSNHFTVDVWSWILLSRKRQTVPRAKFFERIQEILTEERVSFEPKVLATLIQKHFPDWRRVLNECQRYSSSGKIDAGILASFSNVKTDDLFGFLKEKDFPAVRKWVVENSDGDSHHLFRTIYDGFILPSHWSWCCCGCSNYCEIFISVKAFVA